MTPRASTTRRLLLAAYGCYLLVVAFLVFSPQQDTPSSAITGVIELLRKAGFWSFRESEVEFGLNVLMFVPLSLLGALLWARPRWWHWGAIGLALSCAIEATQAALLPDRVGSVRDLCSNTAGALLGIAAVSLVRLERGRSREVRHGPLAPLARVVLVGGGVMVLAWVALLVFAPTSARPSAYVVGFVHGLEGLGAPRWLTSVSLWEFLGNVLLFVPVGVVGALLRPQWTVSRWALGGLLASGAVEVTQGLLLASRDASVRDVAANTLGLVAGVLAGHTVPALLRRRRQQPEPERSAEHVNP